MFTSTIFELVDIFTL